MSLIQAVILGLLQGLTEFLPVSSSGHLVLAQSLIKSFDQPGVLFDVILHLATTMAVIVYFRNSIMKIDREYLILLAIGSIPVVAVGLGVRVLIESFFSSVRLVGVALLITGVLNYLTDRAYARRQMVGRIDALLVGVAQMFSLIPGISRSGATIFAGSSLGIDRKKAAEFSFILSVPAIIGANVLEFYKHGGNNGLDLSVYAVGFMAAFLAAMVAISMVLRVLGEKRFKYFGVYCVILGVAAIIF